MTFFRSRLWTTFGVEQWSLRGKPLISGKFLEKKRGFNKSIVRQGWYSKKKTKKPQHSRIHQPRTAASAWVMFPGAAWLCDLKWHDLWHWAIPSVINHNLWRGGAFNHHHPTWVASSFFLITCAHPGENCTASNEVIPLFFHTKWWLLSHACGNLIFLLLFSSNLPTNPLFFFIYRTQNRLSWGERNLWHVPCIFPACLFPPLVCHCSVVVEKRDTSAEYLKRFSYLQTFPEQSHISSPSTVIWRRTVIC